MVVPFFRYVHVVKCCCIRNRRRSSCKTCCVARTQSYHNFCLSSNNSCKKSALKLIAFVDKMNASYKVRVKIGNASARVFVVFKCMSFDRTAS